MYDYKDIRSVEWPVVCRFNERKIADGIPVYVQYSREFSRARYGECHYKQ